VGRKALIGVVCILAAGAVRSVALADNPQLRPSAADQAIAKHAVVQLSDFTPGSGWTGGPTKSGTSPTTPCNLDPKQSDLVQTGEAESTFKYKVPLLQVYSSATMFRTSTMARLSWERARPGLLGFLRCMTTKALPSYARVVSVKPMGFPQVGSFGGAYRTVFDLTAGATTVRMVIDVEVFGAGRAVMFLMQFAPYQGAAEAKAGETRLATVMTARAGGGGLAA